MNFTGCRLGGLPSGIPALQARELRQSREPSAPVMPYKHYVTIPGLQVRDHVVEEGGKWVK